MKKRPHTAVILGGWAIGAAGASLAGCTVEREPVALIEPTYSYLRPAQTPADTASSLATRDAHDEADGERLTMGP